MKYDLTLSKIRNTQFSKLYNDFIVGNTLNQKQYESILAIAICFTNAIDEHVQQLGYRIIVSYCNQTKNYTPLYEIAINKGLYPISKFIEQHTDESHKNFFTEWNDAFTEQYHLNGVYQSEQQRQLVDFFEEKQNRTISIIAPTSYGKSELILSSIREYAGRKICVLTSTKALLIQTKKRIQGSSKEFFSKIIIHPEMYNPSDSSCLAVLTQERLLRLFTKDSKLAFDCILVDEAHELLENNTRSQMLANVIIVAQARNPNVAIKFLTPFLVDSNNLKTRYTTYDITGFKISEYIKSEKYFLYDIRTHGRLQFYDQFFNEFIPIQMNKQYHFEEEFVKDHSASKNIIYLNKPTDIEKFALALKDVLPDVSSELVSKACENISNYLQPQYNLLACLKKGIIYHHGSVPDAIRVYIEDLYKKDASVKYVITSSTLLSGVNLPAERMFILDNRRGRSNLSSNSFKNLVGRVCRFSEIFNPDSGSLQRLEPQIYLVYGQYFAQNANCEKFLKNVAKVELKYQDSVKNILLKNTEITPANEEDLRHAKEFIENYETGTVDNYQDRHVQTNIGRFCILNGVNEFDIFVNENDMQAVVDKCLASDLKVFTSKELLKLIVTLFIQYLPENKNDNLKRLENQEAQSFYSMLLDWRAQNKSYSETISLFIRYWGNLYQRNQDSIIYVGKWGDIKRYGSNFAHYTKLKDKDRTKLVNLAIVRIKEEQDFIDNTLVKYIEVLYDLSLLDDVFYKKIKYGTCNDEAICLLKNGLSLSSATILLDKYRSHLEIDCPKSTVTFDNTLLYEMQQKNENQIIVHEIESCM